MSCYLVSHAHITALVATAILGPSDSEQLWHFGMTRCPGADALGRQLWAANLRSVAARYPDRVSGDRPGPVGLTDAMVAGYTASTTTLQAARLPAVAALKALDGLEYQSCEADGWEGSETCQWIEAFRRALITQLPGYGQAPWEIDGAG